MSQKDNWAQPIGVEEREKKSNLKSIRIPTDIEEGLRVQAELISKQTGKKIGYQTLLMKIAKQWLDAQK